MNAMRLFSLFLLAALVSMTEAQAFECLGPGGGEVGPKPLIDISASLSKDIHKIGTAGVAREFLFWEHRRHLLMRNDVNDVYNFHVEGCVYHPFLNTPLKLSKVLDSNERFFAFEGKPSFYDTYKKLFYHYSLPAPFYKHRTLSHLFFHQKTLYSLQTEIMENGDQLFTGVSFTVGDERPEVMCRIRFDKTWKLVPGSHYPKFSLYSVVPQGDGRDMVNIKELDITEMACDLHNIKTWKKWFVVGSVENVFRFPENDGLAIKTNDPKKNLLWADSEGCRYYHVGHTKVMTPNPRQPVLLSWDELGQLDLHYLERGEKATILKEGSCRPANSLMNSVWLNSKEDELFLAPSICYGRRNFMLDIKLKPKQP